MLQIEHFTKEYGNKIAVNDLSLEIRSGEIFGFIGHNGAGKTTTIKAVAGILPFQKGEIRCGKTLWNAKNGWLIFQTIRICMNFCQGFSI